MSKNLFFLPIGPEQACLCRWSGKGSYHGEDYCDWWPHEEWQPTSNECSDYDGKSTGCPLFMDVLQHSSWLLPYVHLESKVNVLIEGNWFWMIACRVRKRDQPGEEIVCMVMRLSEGLPYHRSHQRGTAFSLSLYLLLRRLLMCSIECCSSRCTISIRRCSISSIVIVISPSSILNSPLCSHSSTSFPLDGLPAHKPPSNK